MGNRGEETVSKINYTGIPEQDRLIPIFRVIITSKPMEIIRKFNGYKKANTQGHNKATKKRTKNRNKREVYTFRDLG